MQLDRGEIINDTYEVLFHIGRGAFGEVYRVQHKFLGVQIIKLLNQEYVERTNIDEVVHEARLLSALTHPNIVRVFECNTFHKNNQVHFFISMEFVSGETLAQRLKREIRLTIDESLRLQRDILTALRLVHEHNPPIVHRDISPDNILLDYSVEPYKATLTDFGLARSVDQISHLLGAGGKCHYMAPECFHNVYLPTSDVFSAGIVFYQMCTGVFPWRLPDNSTIHSNDELLDQIVQSRRSKPTKPSHITDLDELECIDEVVMKSLEHELDQRYLNANQFLNAIVSVLT